MTTNKNLLTIISAIFMVTGIGLYLGRNQACFDQNWMLVLILVILNFAATVLVLTKNPTSFEEGQKS
jgi:uncharacterized membrane protein HdeD (DUF308 family)